MEEFIEEHGPCWEVKITKKYMILLVDNKEKMSKLLSKISDYYLTMEGIIKIIKMLHVENIKKISKILEKKNA